MAMVAVDPHRPVTVALADGTFPGWLLAWRRDPGGWRGYVRYRRGVGLQHLAWLDAHLLSPD